MTLSSPVGSRNCVSHSAKPVNEKEQMMTATSGRRCLERFGRFPRVGLWAKTFSELLIGHGDWYSSKCKLTWKLKGTKFNRMFFQLVPLTHRTEGTGFGLLPTVTAMDATGVTANMKSTQVKEGSMHSMTLSRLLLPTPTTHQQNTKFKRGGTCLQAKINGLLPTPNTNDSKNNGSRENSEVVQLCQVLGALNPDFVEEMMGFPVGWTELKHSETQSSLKSHTKSSKPSPAQKK